MFTPSAADMAELQAHQSFAPQQDITSNDDRRRNWQLDSTVFNDPIHGHMEIHPLLVKIINTPQFQRLRHIKQLGGAYYVFPGASHNRFEHSIGVSHLAGMLVQTLSERQPELNITPVDILCVKIAGLCHDLGHGPFSHMFDGMFIPKVRPGYEWQHETASLEMFDHLVEENELEPVMEAYGLVLPGDLDFIKEQIAGPSDNSDAPSGHQNWPYNGRPEEKSFLYEIVANKMNGIDVDKMDYFARDSYHLGIKNNFDYRRFIMFARVCEVDGKKHICTREKEVENMYDFFYTRINLHRKAYQHKVVNIIETMITEAFIKANPHIQINGLNGNVTLSESIFDMRAYTKLTDGIFDEILNSTNPNLRESRKILEDIVCRRIYKCVGHIYINAEVLADQEMHRNWAQAIVMGSHLNENDIVINVIEINFGMNDTNPINNMYFYNKQNPYEAFRISEDQVSRIRPVCFAEKLVQAYCKRTDRHSLETAKMGFLNWRHAFAMN